MSVINFVNTNTKKTFTFLKEKILYSIAFYPVVCCLLSFVVVFTLLNVEGNSFIMDFKEKFPFLIVDNNETARAILTTLFAGIMSLTVFSFTMVMVVLNQASSNFSPRLLPGLISKKNHQLILGFYIASLQFCMISLIANGANHSSEDNIGLSVLFASICGICCVGLFVYFIHSISQSIQIENIIENKFRISQTWLLNLLENQKNQSIENTKFDSKDEILIKESGFYQNIDVQSFSKKLKNKAIIIECIPYAEKHIWKNEVVLKINRVLDDVLKEELISKIVITSKNTFGEKSITNLLQLTEIAVRALSPGVNDPRTAINVIAKLGRLLELALQLKVKRISAVENSELQLISTNPDCNELLDKLITPIRNYAENDENVSRFLIGMLESLVSNGAIESKAKKPLKDEIKIIEHNVRKNNPQLQTQKRTIEPIFKIP